MIATSSLSRNPIFSILKLSKHVFYSAQLKYEKLCFFRIVFAVLRVRLILMRIRKKMNPDPDYFSKIHRIFLTRQNFQIFCLIFLLKLYKPFTSQGIFIISLFSLVQIWVQKVTIKFCSFWLIFCPLHLDPWIRIFLRIRILDAKICQILSTGFLIIRGETKELDTLLLLSLFTLKFFQLSLKNHLFSPFQRMKP